MQSIIDTLLTLTRLQSQENIIKSPTHINNIIQETLDIIQKKYPQNSLSTDFTDNLENDSIPANEPLCRILLTNILDNAWKYGDV
jgi:K+-sensing histidine kinase KdpD